MDRSSNDQLTPRQREIAALLATGLTDAEIAERVGGVALTVALDIEGIMNRLQAQSRVDLATWAIERTLAASGGR